VTLAAPPELEALCLYTFAPTDGRDMLGFLAGEALVVLERTNDDWWLARKGTQEGWIPANYVQLGGK
jgi:hypothetical protein